MRYEILDLKGRPREGGEGTLAVDAETLVLTPRSGSPLVVKLGDIDAFEAADYGLRVALYTGDVLRCERLGAAFGQIAAALSENRDAVLRRDLLLEREPPADAFPASVHVSAWGEKAPPRPARVLVYRDQAAVVGDGFEPVLIPYAGLDALRVDAAAYAVELSDEDGTRVAIRKLGIRFEEFAGRLQDAVNELDRRTWAILDALVSGLDPLTARRLVRLCRDGRALKETEAEAFAPGLWARLAAAAIPDETLRASYETLRALGTPGQAWLCIHEGRVPAAVGESGGGDGETANGEGEDGGESPPSSAAPGGMKTDMNAGPEEDGGTGTPAFLCWYYVQAGGAVAHEVVSEGNHATYLYRAGADADRGVRALNRALRLLNFRREPVYAPAEEIESGRLARYRLALRKLAPLRHARESFLGRALHTSPEAWRKGVDAALKRA